MLEGSFQHEDFCGHKGTINPGDLQVNMHLQYVMVCMSCRYADLQVNPGFSIYGMHVKYCSVHAGICMHVGMDIVYCGVHVRCSLPSLQWMTAGRGIVHSEMPGGDGDNIGLQLWVNLKGKDKVK